VRPEQEALGVPPKPYVGGAAVRHVVHGAVFTSNESPPDQRIPFHHGALPAWERAERRQRQLLSSARAATLFLHPEKWAPLRRR
jgi:hypothetical protein